MTSVVLAVLLVTSPVSQDSEARARAALALAQPPAFKTWGDAARFKQPTAVFVGCPARTVPGMLVCQEATFPDVQAGIVIAVPNAWASGGMEWKVTLPVTATDYEIRIAAGLERPQATTFRFPVATSDCVT